MTWINNDDRLKLINKIFEQGKLYRAVAESSSVEAIRKGKNKESAEQAFMYVTMNDTRDQMATTIVDFVNAFWPRESEISISNS